VFALGQVAGDHPSPQEARAAVLVSRSSMSNIAEGWLAPENARVDEMQLDPGSSMLAETATRAARMLVATGRRVLQYLGLDQPGGDLPSTT